MIGVNTKTRIGRGRKSRGLPGGGFPRGSFHRFLRSKNNRSQRKFLDTTAAEIFHGKKQRLANGVSPLRVPSKKRIANLSLSWESVSASQTLFNLLGGLVGEATLAVPHLPFMTFSRLSVDRFPATLKHQSEVETREQPADHHRDQKPVKLNSPISN